MGGSARAGYAAAAAAGSLALALMGPSSLGAQAPAPDLREPVDSVLLLSELPSFVAGARPAFEDHFLRLSTSLSTLEEVRAAAAEAFADSLLYRDVAGYLASEADAERLRSVLAWLGSGAAARVRAITGTTPPPQAFEAFLDGLEEAPPPPRRLALVRRWSQARRAGEFVLLLDEAQREAAHRVAAAVGSDAPRFEPIGEREFGAAHEQVAAYSVLSFLHRLQPVPDTTLAAAVREYESDAGQWLVEAYSLALAHAIREASRRMVRELGAPGS